MKAVPGKTQRVICVGEITRDCVFEAPRIPEVNETLVLDQGDLGIGGSAMNVAWYLTQCGTRIELLGPYGLTDKTEIDAFCSSMEIQTGDRVGYSGRSDVLISALDGDTHRSYLLRSRVPDSAVRQLEARCNRAGSIVICGSRHANIRRAYVRIATSGGSGDIFFGPSYAVFEYCKEELDAIITRSRYVFANVSETQFLTEQLEHQTPADLASHYDITLVSTRGALGAVAFSATDYLEFPAVPVRVCREIGGGDALAAGCISRILAGASLSEALSFGLAVAACVVETSSVRVALSRDRLAELVSYYLRP